jgi:hypothetical protein
MIDNFRPTVSYVPDTYNDNIVWRLSESYNSGSEMLQAFIREKVPNPNVDEYNIDYNLIAFKKAPRKIGYQLDDPNGCFSEPLWLMPEVYDNGLQTIWWWTESGEGVFDLSGDALYDQHKFYELDFEGWTIDNSASENTCNRCLIEWENYDSPTLLDMGIDAITINFNNADIVDGSHFMENIEAPLRLNGLNNIHANNLEYFLNNTYNIVNDLNINNAVLGDSDEDIPANITGMFHGSNSYTNVVNINGWNIYTGSNVCELNFTDSMFTTVNASNWTVRGTGFSFKGNYDIADVDISSYDIDGGDDPFTLSIDLSDVSDHSSLNLNMSDWSLSGEIVFDGIKDDMDTLNMSGMTIDYKEATECQFKFLNDDNLLDINEINLSNLTITNFGYTGHVAQPLFNDCSGSIDTVDLSNWTINDSLFGDLVFCNMNTLQMPNLRINNTPFYGLIIGGNCNTADLSNFVGLNNRISDSIALIRGVTSVNVSNWDLTGVTSLSNITGYYDSSSAYNIIGLDTWDVSNITKFDEMLCGVQDLSSLTAWRDMLNPNASYDDIFTGTDITNYPEWNGWFDDKTFYPYHNQFSVCNELFFKGVVSYETDLPQSDNTLGDCYLVYNYHWGSGMNDTTEPFVWNGSTWCGVDVFPSITATYTQTHTIYPNSSESDIRVDLVVTGSNGLGSNIPITNYTLSPTAPYSVGTQVMTVTCGNISTTFNMTVTPNVTYLYDWDFTQSLVDAGGADALFHTDLSTAATTTTPATGQFVQGTGLIMRQKSALDIPVNILSPSTSYTVEIDFSNFNLALTSWCYGFVASIPVDSYEKFYSGLPNDADGLMVCVDGTEGSYNSYMSNISSQTYFANSTLKIVNRKAANENVVLDFYKDDTLLFSTPDHGSDPSEPFFWDDSVGVSKYVISGHGDELDATITGMRIYENT